MGGKSIDWMNFLPWLLKFWFLVGYYNIATDFWLYYLTFGLKSSPTDALGQCRTTTITGWGFKSELSPWVGQENRKTQLSPWVGREHSKTQLSPWVGQENHWVNQNQSLCYNRNRSLGLSWVRSRPRLQTAQLSPRAYRPLGLVGMSAVLVWTNPWQTSGLYSLNILSISSSLIISPQKEGPWKETTQVTTKHYLHTNLTWKYYQLHSMVHP